MNPNQPLIDAGSHFVLSVAGGGSQALGELLRHGGMSDVLLWGHVLQDRAITDIFLGRKPDRYASADTARQLAMKSYLMACHLRPEGEVFGVGCTSSLVRPGGEREGRRHEAYIALQRADLTLTLSAALKEARTREEEEAEVARLIHTVVAWGARRFAVAAREGTPDVIDVETTFAEPGWDDLVCGRIGTLSEDRGPYILPSSLDPLHEGHVAMMRYVHEATGSPVDLELCVMNADKPPLDFTAIGGRLARTRDALGGNPCFSGRIHLTNAGLFWEKSSLYPNTVFLVGSDTARRIGDVEYADGDPATLGRQLEAIYDNHCSLLVFNRPGSELDRGGLVPTLSRVVGFAGPAFVPNPASSTSIRNAGGA